MKTARAAAKGGLRDPAAEVGLGAGGSAAMAEQMREKMATINTVKDTCIVFAIVLSSTEREREREIWVMAKTECWELSMKR